MQDLVVVTYKSTCPYDATPPLYYLQRPSVWYGKQERTGYSTAHDMPRRCTRHETQIPPMTLFECT